MDSKDGLDIVLNSFEPVEVRVWIDRIVTDLRGKSIEDVSWAYDRELSISPFAPRPTGEPQGADVGFTPDWEIAEEFDLTEPAQTNALILEALRGGCETLLVRVDEPADWTVLFTEVHLNMVNTYVIVAEEKRAAIIASLNAWMARNGIEDGLIRVRSSQVTTMGAAHEAREQTTVDLLVKTVTAGIEAIEGSSGASTIECVAEVGPYFFIEVARLRALRILWANVLDALGREGPDLFVEVRLADKFLSDDRHANMISAGTKALAAICGNADRLVLNTSAQEIGRLESRIARNVHHILRYESKVNGIPDPVKGSFYFENLTEELVLKSWAKITSD